MSDYMVFFFLLLGLMILYRYVIPYCFPTVVQGVSLVKLDGSDEVYAFQGGKLPFVNTKKSSHVKALRRRQQNVYNAAKV